jgi:hypothetical protein
VAIGPLQLGDLAKGAYRALTGDEKRMLDRAMREKALMNRPDISFLPLSWPKQIRKKKISPVELVEAHLAQIEKLNPKLNAFVQVDAERARRAARDAESAVMREKTLGPLHGVPISIKSSLASRNALRGRNPAARGICARSRRAAGGALAEAGAIVFWA